MLPAFIRPHPRLALFALLATATSGFGQTFFVAVFGGAIREDLGISHGLYGSLYSAATLASALLLFQAGTLADRWPLPRLTALTLAGLAIGCVVMGLSQNPLMLLLGFFLIRFTGQGMITHLGMTTAGRYFTEQRGKIMALTACGFPLAEALMPLAGALIIAGFGWRSAWFFGAGVILLVLLPLLTMLARAATPRAISNADNGATSHAATGWRRDQVRRDSGFYRLLPAVLMVPFTVTAILFHQSAISDEKAWPLTLMASAFSGYALGHLAMLAVAGPLVDRLGAQRVLPLLLLPMLVGLLLLSYGEANWIPLLYLTLIGLSQGGIATASGALWPERYGTAHLGAIRAMTQSIMVFSTAASPILMGILLDWQVSATHLALGLALLTALACLSAVGVKQAAHR